MDGSPKEAVSSYLNLGLDSRAAREWADLDSAPGGEVARLRSVRARTEDGQIIDSVDIRERFAIEMEYHVFKPGYVLMPNYHFNNEENLHVFSVHDTDSNWEGRPRPPGRYVSTVWIPGNLLSEGTLRVSFCLTSLKPIIDDVFLESDAVTFKVIDSPGGRSARGEWRGPMDGVIRPLLDWTTRYQSLEAVNEQRLT
jgi:lipopolysaccharide transport system ATP-binding protein